MKEPIEKILAEKYGADEKTVQKDMMEAIELACENQTPLWQLLFGKNRIPDMNEFCNTICEMMTT